MSIQNKPVRLPRPEPDPELREFIDEVLVPMLVRDALSELTPEIRLAPTLSVVAQSPRRQEDQ